jgi:peroxiredoxin
VASQFGLTYSVSAPFQQYYRSILVNIPLLNGDESWQLPLPATYVIAPDNTILQASAHADFRVRPDPLEVLEALPPGTRTTASVNRAQAQH